MQPKISPYSFDLIIILRIMLKWKWSLVIITLIAALTAYIFTGPAFIAPQYTASVVFYPTSNTSISGNLGQVLTAKQSLLDFGEKEEAEQLMQILNSDEIKKEVINKFNLYKHYGIDTSQVKQFHLIKFYFQKKITFKRTEYLAIQVNVNDTDPQMAADIANYIAELVDKTKSNIQKERARQAFLILKNEYQSKVRLMDSIDQILNTLRANGVYDYFTQAAQLNQKLIDANATYEEESAKLRIYEENKGTIPDSTRVKTLAKVRGAKATMKIIEPRLKKVAAFGGQYIDNINNLELERKKLAELKFSYDKARLDYEKELPQKFLINKAIKPEIPSSPRRLLITFLAAASSFFLALIVIIFVEVLLPPLRKDLAYNS